MATKQKKDEAAKRAKAPEAPEEKKERKARVAKPFWDKFLSARKRLETATRRLSSWTKQWSSQVEAGSDLAAAVEDAQATVTSLAQSVASLIGTTDLIRATGMEPQIKVRVRRTRYQVGNELYLSSRAPGQGGKFALANPVTVIDLDGAFYRVEDAEGMSGTFAGRLLSREPEVIEPEAAE